MRGVGVDHTQDPDLRISEGVLMILPDPMVEERLEPDPSLQLHIKDHLAGLNILGLLHLDTNQDLHIDLHLHQDILGQELHLDLHLGNLVGHLLQDTVKQPLLRHKLTI